MGELHWLIDSSHQCHDDCKGQSGAGMTMGKGAILSGSAGQKCNTKSSTETEIVGVGQYLPTVLWSKYFIEAQGYTIEHTIIHQDNESTIRLLVNGPLSSSKRTKHIKAKYYLAKDYSDRGEIKFSYLPTDKMWIDMHTKPKQGTPFRTDRAKLMNCPVNYDDDVERANTHPSLLPESGVQTSVIKRPSAPNHRGSVLRNKHKVSTPGIS